MLTFLPTLGELTFLCHEWCKTSFLSSIPGSGPLREAVWQLSEPSIGVSTAQCQSSNKPIILGFKPPPTDTARKKDRLELQRRYVVWILAVSRHVVFLENYYYIMLLHPHHLHHPHPPFLIFLFLICHSLRKLRRNRPVKAQRMMQRSCHRLLSAPVGNYSELSAPSAPSPSESVVPLRRFNRQSVSTVWYGYYPEIYGASSSFFTTLNSVYVASTYKQAAELACWRKAIDDELQALEENHTCLR